MSKTEINQSVITDWKKRSEKGEVCGIFGCEGKPTTICPHCGNWYCKDHSFVLRLPGHFITSINLLKEK